MSLFALIKSLTCPCTDDGKKFIRKDRLVKIEKQLIKTHYKILKRKPLAQIYRHKYFDPEKPCTLISTHIDAIYKKHFYKQNAQTFSGTFDNSICNAIVAHFMQKNSFSPQTLVAFTGDEEGESRGANQTVGFLKKQKLLQKLQLVITLDLTEDGYPYHSFTIENYFVQNKKGPFKNPLGLKKHLHQILKDKNPKYIKNAAEDESWRYRDLGLNGFSLCLPCRVRGSDMHEDRGVVVKQKAAKEYAKALSLLSNMCL